jgi:hypothetical protein
MNSKTSYTNNSKKCNNKIKTMGTAALMLSKSQFLSYSRFNQRKKEKRDRPQRY